ncbi:MAG: protein kinase [Planctomycetaceae bacterium]|jgi:WD40 repeat protein/serine/threonine protein kinase|nr:protein kinase [Planctomycetaceae bacterium]
MFTAICPHCSHPYKLDDSLIGKRATCKQCRNVFVLTNTTPPVALTDLAFDLQPQQTTERKSFSKKTVQSFSADSGLWNVGDLILGVYEVQPLAEGVPYAEGGVGVVQRVYHREWDMHLAVKSPKPQFFQSEHGKKSYEHEAQTWVELGLHPNIVTCYLVRRIGGIPRLFAEFVSDGSLRDWILDGRLYEGGSDAALLRILNIAIQFAWGLEHAHRQTLLHLDVKPANVMMSDQTPKVSDFGLSQTAMEGNDNDDESDNYVTIGMTPGYCSPEQYLSVELMKQQRYDDLPKLTVQTDMWSWAVSVFSMFRGGPPCNKQGGQNARSVFQKFLQRPPSDTLPEVPNAAAKLLLRCFESEPEKRPESMEQIADELTKIYKDVAGSAFPRPKPVNAVWTPDSINNRAMSLLDLNKPAESAKLFNQAIAMQPWHPTVTYNRTMLSWRLAQLTDVAAIEQLETLIKMRPKESKAVYVLGLAQRERGNLAAALELFSDSLDMEDKEDVRRAISATESLLTDEARFLENFSLSDTSERKVYADSTGEFILFYSEPQMLALHSTVTGQLRRTFKMPDVQTKEGERLALSSDLLWGLYAEQGGFSVRRVGNAALVYTFQKINWGRLSAKQVVLPEKALMGDVTKNRVVISDINTKHIYGSLLGHEDDITALTLSADGRFALTAGDDRTVRLWELPSCRCLRTFSIPKQTVDAVYLGPNGLFALSVTASGLLRLWSTAILCRPKAFRAPFQLSHVTSAEEAGRQQSEMDRLCDEIRQSARRKDYGATLEWIEKAKKMSGWESARNLLETDGVGDKIRRRTVREEFDSALCTHTLSGHQEAVTSIAISLDANLIASAGQDGEIRVWNIAEQKCVADIEGHQDEIRSLAMTSDARFLISGGRDGSVWIWNIESRQCVRRFSERVMTLTKIALNPQGRTVAIADSFGTILFWDAVTNSVIDRFSSRSGGVSSLRFSRDGHYLAAGGDEGSLTIWKMGNQAPLYAYRDIPSPLTATTLSVDMSRCYSADKSGRITTHNLHTDKQEQSFSGHIGEISGLELLSDSRFLFSAGKDGLVKVWRLTEPMISASIEGHPAAVTAMKLEISGRRLITGSADGVVRVWELLWNYRFPGWQPITSKTKSVLYSLMSMYSEDGKIKPNIDEATANRIILEMDYCGFGTIPSETLRQTLQELLAGWKAV